MTLTNQSSCLRGLGSQVCSMMSNLYSADWVSNPECLTASYPSYLQPSGEFISPVLAYSTFSGIRGSVGWKNSSVVSSSCCSCRELEFSLQQTHGGSQSRTLVPGNLTPSFFCLHGHSMHTIHVHTRRQHTHTHREIFFKRIKKNGWLHIWRQCHKEVVSGTWALD